MRGVITMAKRVNYWKCPYRLEEEDETLALQTVESMGYHPCNNPRNITADCPLDNKGQNQLDECKLLRR